MQCSGYVSRQRGLGPARQVRQYLLQADRFADGVSLRNPLYAADCAAAIVPGTNEHRIRSARYLVEAVIVDPI